MNWVDDVVRNAAPPAFGSEPAAAGAAEAIARSVVAKRARERAGLSRLRRLIWGTTLGIGVLGLGITAATAGPAVFEWVGWTPDVVAQRSFELAGGPDLGLCEVLIRVVPDYNAVSKEEADRRTAEARRFLAENDWEPFITSITESEIQAAFAEEIARRSVAMPDGTIPPPASLSLVVGQLMGDRISDEFERAGHLRQGVSLEGAGGPCDGANEGSKQR